ncbi:MAG: hypothetical protein AVO33_09880 [delta proteobacterium ML8_F1]|nr:MAG: hypothetical protein AVO33_09880 [delta proteobacterium ML8_F1]
MDNKPAKKAFNYNYPVVAFLYTWAFVFLISATTIKDSGSKIFPYFVSGMAIFLATILLIKNLFNIGIKEEFDFSGTAKATKYFGLLFAYITAASYVGYYLATPIYLILSMRALGQKNYKIMIISAIVVSLFIYVFFDLSLDMKIPEGVLFD